MAKLIIALSLLFSGANAMGIYGGTARPSAEPTSAPELNGCGDPCADVVNVKAPEPFPPIEAGTCYVVDGDYQTVVRVSVACVKITIPIGSRLQVICPRPHNPTYPPRATYGSRLRGA